MKTYLVKIVTKKLQTKFNIDSELPIDTTEKLHKHVIDFLGKNDIEWEPNRLKYTRGFYITYEELDNGKKQHGTIRKETQPRV
tara:strand:- start:172 stop:420 length:249 start_codon:yes stop_codon:yes gene_type:complete